MKSHKTISNRGYQAAHGEGGEEGGLTITCGEDENDDGDGATRNSCCCNKVSSTSHKITV